MKSITDFITHHISQYMKNSKINVEGSSWIPPTCLPASTDVKQYRKHHFQFYMIYSVKQNQYRNSTNWLAVQSNSQHTVNQTISNSYKNTTWNYKLFRVSEIYSHWTIIVNDDNHCLIQTIYFSINCDGLQLTRGQFHFGVLVHTIPTQLTVRQSDYVWERYRFYKLYTHLN